MQPESTPEPADEDQRGDEQEIFGVAEHDKVPSDQGSGIDFERLVHVGSIGCRPNKNFILKMKFRLIEATSHVGPMKSDGNF